MVRLEKVKKFLNAARRITGSVATVNDGDSMNHYRMFVARLETIFIKSCKKFNPSILGRKEIIQSILKKENIAVFRNVKVIIHLICVACVKIYVESVVPRFIWKTFWFFTTAYRTTFFGRNDHCWERTFTTPCCWNTTQSNEPVLEGWK